MGRLCQWLAVLCSCTAASNAAAPRQRNAELLGTESAEKSHHCSLRLREQDACFLASYCRNWPQSFSPVLNGRSQKSSFWWSSHLGQRCQGPAAVASFWSWLFCEMVSAWARTWLRWWVCASMEQYVFFSFLRLTHLCFHTVKLCKRELPLLLSCGYIRKKFAVVKLCLWLPQPQ